MSSITIGDFLALKVTKLGFTCSSDFVAIRRMSAQSTTSSPLGLVFCTGGLHTTFPPSPNGCSNEVESPLKGAKVKDNINQDSREQTCLKLFSSTPSSHVHD